MDGWTTTPEEEVLALGVRVTLTHPDAVAAPRARFELEPSWRLNPDDPTELGAPFFCRDSREPHGNSLGVIVCLWRASFARWLDKPDGAVIQMSYRGIPSGQATLLWRTLTDWPLSANAERAFINWANSDGTKPPV